MSSYTRYQIRNSLFRLRDKRVENQELADAVWEIIRPQLDASETLSNFTFTWDVNPYNPTQVIRRSEWDAMKKARYPKDWDTQSKVEEEVTLFTGQK